MLKLKTQNIKNWKYLYCSIIKISKSLLKIIGKIKRRTNIIKDKNKSFKKSLPLLLGLIWISLLVLVETLDIQIITLYLS